MFWNFLKSLENAIVKWDFIDTFSPAKICFSYVFCFYPFLFRFSGSEKYYALKRLDVNNIDQSELIRKALPLTVWRRFMDSGVCP